MKDLNLYDLCLIARSLYVDFSKLTYEEGNDICIPNSSGYIVAGSTDVEMSNIEYNKLSVLIRVLQDIYKFRPLPF